MNQIKALKFRIRISEYIHLALLALLYAIPVALFFDEDAPAYRFVWALGTVIPTLLIRFLCEQTEKRGARVLLSLAVIGLTMLVTGRNYHWTYYLLTTVPIAFLGSLFPKARITGLFTVPSVFALVFVFPAYVVGKMLESRQINMHTDIILVLTALLIVNYLINVSQNGLLIELRRAADVEISVSGMIRQNRRTVLLFLLISASLLAIVPILMPKEKYTPGPQIIEVEATDVVERTEPTEETVLPIENSENTPAVHLDFLENAYLIFLAAAALGAFGLAFFLLKAVFAKRQSRGKDVMSEPREGLTVEHLEVEKEKREREKLSGWEKKIRRGYEKLILGRSKQNTRLRFMTPSELESAASLPAGPETRTLHEIYEQTRYSTVPPTREDYARFKEAEKSLPATKQKKERLI